MSGERIPVNLGNPAELPLNALAETVVRFTESSSTVICSALPIDDRKARRSDITRAKEPLGWEPAAPLTLGLTKVVDFEKSIRSHALTALL